MHQCETNKHLMSCKKIKNAICTIRCTRDTAHKIMQIASLFSKKIWSHDPFYKLGNKLRKSFRKFLIRRTNWIGNRKFSI
ncbi:unnamed protein product [Blepharisma stoltei]|uniref:Uncharacterized protein n=1 Tax=Blepharisma stoltei TaxID=1481888 RepID=A0AAU9J4C3_9CILI|nr:unnamed protein product [Blepharisma stoltei]